MAVDADDSVLPSDGDILVVNLRGVNSPEVTPAFLEAVRQADVPVRIIDAAQYVVEGSLVLSLIFQFVGPSSIRMMQTLLETARDLDMILDFDFPRAVRSPQRGEISECVRRARRVSRKAFSPCLAPVRSITEPARTESDRSHEANRVVNASMVLDRSTPVALLKDVFRYVAEQDGKVMEVVQRHENTIRWNGSYDRLGLTLSCPCNVPISRLYLDLRELCWKHQAEVAVREFAAMNFPSAKSLVVFGLSDVLCTMEFLDELLQEAEVFVEALPRKASSTKSVRREPAAKSKPKLEALKGVPASIQQRVLDRIRFTPGARFVCRALKELGFRLAIITNTGGLFIAEAVKQMLGMDYAVSPEYGIDDDGNLTGQHAGAQPFVRSNTGWKDTGDLELRKFDFLQLLADKEGIEPRDVIVVGRFLEDYSAAKQTVNEILDNYGPQIYFHARRPSDNRDPAEGLRDGDEVSLTVLFYLLGFSGYDVQALEKKYEDAAAVEGATTADVEVAKDIENVRKKARERAKPKGLRFGRRCLVRVQCNENNTKSFEKLLQPLLIYQDRGELEMLSSQLITIASGDAFLGLELVLKGENPKAPLKDILFDSHELGMNMDWDMSEMKTSPSSIELCDMGIEPKNYSRYIITLVKKPGLTVPCLARAFRPLAELKVECVKMDRLSWHGDFSALRVTAMVPCGIEDCLRKSLLEASQEHEVDIAFQKAGVERWGRRLIAFDMDNTLIQGIAVDELAKVAGADVVEKTQVISEKLKKGELSIVEALKEKVMLLKGKNASRLTEPVIKAIVFTHGAHRLCRTLKRLGYVTVLISGGIMQIARAVQHELELDYAFANELEVDPETGDFTGCTIGPVVTPERKRVLLSRIAEVEGCTLSQTVAVGDGVSDIPMLRAAGLGVAFCGKPQVQAVADLRVNSKDLSTVLYLLGLSEAVAMHLGRDKGRGRFRSESDQSLDEKAHSAVRSISS